MKYPFAHFSHPTFQNKWGKQFYTYICAKWNENIVSLKIFPPTWCCDTSSHLESSPQPPVEFVSNLRISRIGISEGQQCFDDLTHTCTAIFSNGFGYFVNIDFGFEDFPELWSLTMFRWSCHSSIFFWSILTAAGFQPVSHQHHALFQDFILDKFEWIFNFPCAPFMAAAKRSQFGQFCAKISFQF